MKIRRSPMCVSLVLALVAANGSQAQDQPAPQATPALQINSNLVILDVTVLDKKGKPVVKGLTRDDFTISEDKAPQRIFSFEAPDAHILKRGAREDGEGKAPVTVLVLDLLNSSFEEIAYFRHEVKSWLISHPSQLPAPAELLAIRDPALEMLQGYTRSRDDLVYALDHLPAVLPFKYSRPAFFGDRFAQSMDALQQVALPNRGVPGRKNVIWVGRGGPGVNLLAPSLTRRDIMEIAQSEHVGAEYYTLSYQPHEIEPDGKFRHIRVTLRDPNLRAVTKAGYYAPEKDAPLHPRQEALDKLIEAALSTIPFNALDVHLFGVVRHPDTRTAEFTVMLASKNLTWLPADDGKDSARLTLAVASLDPNRAVLASKVEHVTLEVEPAKLDRVPQVATQFRVAIRVPGKTKSMRVAMESDDGGRIGAAELNRKSIDAAPEAPTAEPQLNPQPAGVQPAVPAKPAPHAAQPDK